MRTPKMIKSRPRTNPSLVEIARQVQREDRAHVISSRGSPLAVVVTLPQYRLTQAIVHKLEDEEDAAFTRAALADTDPASWRSLDDIRKELGLARHRPQSGRKGASQTAKKSRRKAGRNA